MSLVNYSVRSPHKINPVNELLDELYQGKFKGSIHRFSPPVDIYEDDQLYKIILSVPGMKKNEIKIDLSENKLQVSGNINIDLDTNRINYHVQEIPKGTFTRLFHVPKDVNQEKIEARYEEGLLKLVLPKSKKLKQKYQIEVK